MKRLVKFVILILIFSGLSACQTTSNAIPLQKNIWQVTTNGSGALAAARVEEDLLLKAATLTLEQGYDKFLLRNPQSKQTQHYAGNTPVYANTNVNVYGNTGYANTTYSGGQPIIITQKTNSVIVIMFKNGEKGSQNALDARTILEQLDKKK